MPKSSCTEFIVKSIALSLLGVGASQAALIDRGGGLIYDDVKNVTWLQDTQYARTSGYSAERPAHLAGRQHLRAEPRVLRPRARCHLERLAPAHRGEFPDCRPATIRPASTSELAYMYYVNLGLVARRPATAAKNAAIKNDWFPNLVGRALLDRHRRQTEPLGLGIPVRLRSARDRRHRDGASRLAGARRRRRRCRQHSVPEPGTLALLALGLVAPRLAPPPQAR